MLSRCLTIFVATLIFVSDAMAQEPYRWRFRQGQVENDVFPAVFSDRTLDRFYTSGLRVSFGSNAIEGGADARSLPFWLRPVAKRCPDCRLHPNFSVGHQMYTPGELEIAEPQPGDRPWAAWLYSAFGAAVDTSDSTRHHFEIQTGITGDAAGGKTGQRVLHELIDEEDPRGWDNQLGPDFGVNGYYDLQHIWRKSNPGSRVSWDFTPTFRAAVGTMTTYVGGGGTLRIGRNLTDFPYVSERSNERTLPERSPQRIEWYGFFGVDVRAVAYNYFLEGSLFDDDGITIDPERYVGDLTIGFTARYRRFKLTYAMVYRSEEFERLVGTDGANHSYGSISLTVGLR